jgi:hypothetical protein
MSDEYISEGKGINYATFRDCFFGVMIGSSTPSSKPSGKRHKTITKAIARSSSARDVSTVEISTSGHDPAEWADFSDFIASEIFPSLPTDLQTLSHQNLKDSTDNADKWSLPLTLSNIEELAELIPPSVNDSLFAYGLIQPPKSDVQSFISPIISSYIATVTTPPPKWITTRAAACEICERDWIPLTYHHLIPRGVHAKVLKRGWHEEQVLNSVAWLCRACHSFVHKMASNEELAREWYTVDKICSREDVQKWAQWVGKVRWKKS